MKKAKRKSKNKKWVNSFLIVFVILCVVGSLYIISFNKDKKAIFSNSNSTSNLINEPKPEPKPE